MDEARAAFITLLTDVALPAALRVLAGLLVFAIVWRGALLARLWFHRSAARATADPNLQLLLGRLIYLAVLAVGAVWALDIAGLSPAAFLTALGVVGLAITLALQDVLRNFFAGVYLLFERPFRIGDEITVKDVRGRVVDVGMRITSLRTDDGVLVLIPNAVLLAEVVSNRSA
jgi:small conductance mechanosensitive channel